MPNIEVRVLDLRDSTATPLRNADDTISAARLNYLWVTVRDILTGVETHLRFMVTEKGLLLRRTLRMPQVIDELESELRRALAGNQGDFHWYATMIHCPIAGLGQVDSFAIAIGDNLQVDALGDWEEFWVKPKVNFGEVTELLLVAS